MKCNVFIGQKYHRLLVVARPPGKAVCTCDCGGTTSVKPANLVTGHTKSCGCLSSEPGLKAAQIANNAARARLIGMKVGKLTILKFVRVDYRRTKSRGLRKRPITRFLCRCDCGTEKIVSGAKLQGNEVKSCGCVVVERAVRL